MLEIGIASHKREKLVKKQRKEEQKVVEDSETSDGGFKQLGEEVVRGSGVIAISSDDGIGKSADATKEKRREQARKVQQGQTKLTLQNLEVVKYVADLVKALWDCELKHVSSELAFILAGLVAGVLSTHKQMLKCMK